MFSNHFTTLSFFPPLNRIRATTGRPALDINRLAAYRHSASRVFSYRDAASSSFSPRSPRRPISRARHPISPFLFPSTNGSRAHFSPAADTWRVFLGRASTEPARLQQRPDTTPAARKSAVRDPDGPRSRRLLRDGARRRTAARRPHTPEPACCVTSRRPRKIGGRDARTNRDRSPRLVAISRPTSAVQLTTMMTMMTMMTREGEREIEKKRTHATINDRS